MRAQKMKLTMAVVALLAASTAAQAGNGRQSHDTKKAPGSVPEECFQMALSQVEDQDGIKGELEVSVSCRKAELSGRLILTADGELIRDASISGVDSAKLEGLLEGSGEVEVCGYFIGEIKVKNRTAPAAGQECRSVNLGGEA